MDSAHKAAGSDTAPMELAKAALRRLVQAKLDPTPENYARAYQQEAGGGAPPALPAAALPVLDRLVAGTLGHAGSAAQREVHDALTRGEWAKAEQLVERQRAPDTATQATQLASLIERLTRGLERGGRQWTSGRKKESLQRVLSSTRSDVTKLQQRIGQLIGSWETDTPDEDTVTGDLDPLGAPSSPAEPLPHPPARAAGDAEDTVPAALDSTPPAPPQNTARWSLIVGELGGAVQAALPPPPAASDELARSFGALRSNLPDDGPGEADAAHIAELCRQAGRVLQHRHHLIDQLGGLCRELTASLTDLAEDDSWAQGQCDAMRIQLEDGLTARSVKSVSELLQDTRERQSRLRDERAQARDALKQMIHRMLSEIGELGAQTGRFHENIGRYVGEIEKADSLESLAGTVREMVEESRAVEALVHQTQDRLQNEHQRASELTDRVNHLEGELRRLSLEVSTDQLTQIANRRGLLQVFDVEQAKLERNGGELCVGLLDIDNFKRLNDELGHNAGDQALKALAATVSEKLRPGDLVARYGGEEFVVLLPSTPVDEGAQILTRLQRSLSGGLFMHESKQIFVTFSAGVTAFRLGEPLQVALERADQALYEAKRTGKNRTCVG